MNKAYFDAMVAAMDVADEAWRTESWSIGIISGHQHHCRAAHAVLTVLAEHLDEDERLGRDDLLTIAADIIEHEHDSIDAMRARLAARHHRPSTADTS